MTAGWAWPEEMFGYMFHVKVRSSRIQELDGSQQELSFDSLGRICVFPVTDGEDGRYLRGLDVIHAKLTKLLL